MSWFTKKIITPPFVFSLHRVLRELVGIMAASRAEIRAVRKQLEEMKMNIDDLSRNVAALIDASAAQKQRADAAVATAAEADAQQPQIDELNSKVVAALGSLGGAPTTVTVASSGIDPNAPVT